MRIAHSHNCFIPFITVRRAKGSIDGCDLIELAQAIDRGRPAPLPPNRTGGFPAYGFHPANQPPSKAHSPFAPQKCVCEAHFRGAKCDNRSWRSSHTLSSNSNRTTRSSFEGCFKTFQLTAQLGETRFPTYVGARVLVPQLIPPLRYLEHLAG